MAPSLPSLGDGRLSPPHPCIGPTVDCRLCRCLEGKALASLQARDNTRHVLTALGEPGSIHRPLCLFQTFSRFDEYWFLGVEDQNLLEIAITLCLLHIQSPKKSPLSFTHRNALSWASSLSTGHTRPPGPFLLKLLHKDRGGRKRGCFYYYFFLILHSLKTIWLSSSFHFFKC